MTTPTTQSAHVCTNTYADRLLFVQAAECSRAALAVLRKKWLEAKSEGANKDALLLGWRALEEKAKEEEDTAIRYGHLLHLGAAGAVQHAHDDAWRNHLIDAARKVVTC